MHLYRNQRCSRKSRRSLLLERLEERCVPTSGLLSGTDLPALPIVSLQAERFTQHPAVIAMLVSNSHSAIHDDLGSEKAISSATISTHRDHPGEEGSDLLGTLVSTPSTVVQVTITTVKGLVSALPEPVLDLGSASSPVLTQVSSTVSAVTNLHSEPVQQLTHDVPSIAVASTVPEKPSEVVVEIPWAYPLPIFSEASVALAASAKVGSGLKDTTSNASASGVRWGPTLESALEGPGGSTMSGSPALLTNAAALQNLPFGNVTAFIQNRSPYLPSSPSLSAGLSQDSWVGGSVGLGQAMLSSLPPGMSWRNLVGAAGPGTGRGVDFDRTVSAVRAQRAELTPGEQEEVPSELAADLSSLAPLSSGLLHATDDLGALERAFQDFLDGLVDLRQTMCGWLGRLGPLPWVLMGLAVAVTLHEQTSRRRRCLLERKDAEEQMEEVLFSAPADA